MPEQQKLYKHEQETRPKRETRVSVLSFLSRSQTRRERQALKFRDLYSYLLTLHKSSEPGPA